MADTRVGAARIGSSEPDDLADIAGHTMKTPSDQSYFEPFLENRRSFLLLRWLIIILASYLTLFSNLRSQNFIGIFVLVVAFSVSNIAMGFLPKRSFVAVRSSRLAILVDAIFICGFLYLLRLSGPPIHFPLMGIFILVIIWRDLRIVLFSLLVVSVLFGVFSYVDFLGATTSVPLEEFLELALFFVVTIFYVFLVARFDRDALTSMAMLEETRNSEAMVEIARTLSTSMNKDDIYEEIVTRLRDAIGGTACLVVRVEGDQVVVLASSRGSDEVGQRTPLEGNPPLKTAYQENRVVYLGGRKTDDGVSGSTLAIPIAVRGEIEAMICLEGERSETEPSSTRIHFFEAVASTAGNALRNVQMFDEMKHLARTDFLTGLPNHRFFQATLSREVSRAQRHNHSLSLLIIDLDFLKKVNDRFGHPAGDAVIRAVAKTIQSTCRDIDFAARYGGEEFVVILPETDLGGAIQVAERVRMSIESTDVGIVGQVTASVGVANYPVNASCKEDLIRVADQALYVAKDGGRNQVAHFKYQFTTI